MSEPENQRDNNASPFDAPLHQPQTAPDHGAPGLQSRYEPTRTEEPARIGEVGRFTGVLFSPGETFEDINRKPSWIVPLLISIAVACTFWWFVLWYFDAGWQQFMRKTLTDRAAQSGQPAPTDENVAKAFTFTKAIYYALGVFGPLIISLLVAGVFALGMMVMQAQTTFKKIFSVVLWSGAVTGVVSIIVTIASVLFVRDANTGKDFDPQDLGSLSATNPGALLPSSTSAVVKALASSIDVFTIWYLILLSIGLAAIAGSKKIKTANTAKLVFGLWIIVVLIKVGAAALGFGQR
jgi:hypothetical protein